MTFPNQVELTVLTLEQVECLTSAVRSDVFWAFSASEAMSAAQVAKALGKSAQTVHYHVAELLKVGLLLAVDSRQNRSRTEVLYVHSGKDTIDQGRRASREHHEMRAKSFRFTAKTLVKETDAYYKLISLDPDFKVVTTFSRMNVMLTEEQALRLREKMNALLAEIVAEQPISGGARMHVMFYCRPTQGQSAEWIEELEREREGVGEDT